MKLASERTAGLWVPVEPSLEGMLARLEALSIAPAFAVQRQLALGRAMGPYFEMGAGALLAPLPQEVESANLYLYADFYPEDGQPTLIEQLRDVITEHVPEEERAWLDPVKHSYLDLVEVLPAEGREGPLVLRSIGDGRRYRVQGGEAGKRLMAGQVLLTRLIREPGDLESEEAVCAGSAIVLSAGDGRALYESVGEYRRDMEVAAGSFELGEWQEFVKRYGHVLLWKFAQMRFAALVEAVVGIQYRTASGQPFLYALALYEHHEYKFLAGRLSEREGLEAESVRPPNGEPPIGGGVVPVRTWVQRESKSGDQPVVVSRLSLTATQLIVECDSRDRLDTVKHLLAAEFGFSLHFRGETVTPPPRRVTESQLAQEESLALAVTAEEERALLSTFLDNAYLEWADRESPALHGQTPRSAATSSDGCVKVAAMINDMERHDLGLRRTGQPAFDYNRLRAHVGLA